MSDIIDLANDLTQMQLSGYQDNAKTKGIELVSTGYCYFCHELVSGTFCDADCLDDFQSEQAQLQKLGRA